jgi:hypothetical protein
MEQLLDKKTVTQEGCPFSCPYYTGGEVKYAKGMLPQTDKLLKRAINISIGVWDKGLGAAYGLKINSSPVEVEEKAETLYQTLRKYL